MCLRRISFSLKIIDHFILVKLGTRVGQNGYPKSLVYIFTFINFAVLFFALRSFATKIRNKKHLFIRLTIIGLMITLINYILFFIYDVVIHNYFPIYDVNFESAKGLGIPYDGPIFNPLKDLIWEPFYFLYHQLLSIKYFSIDSINNILNQGIFKSIIISLLLFFLNKNQKNYS